MDRFGRGTVAFVAATILLAALGTATGAGAASRPTITALSPTEGNVAGGRLVTLTGTGFTNVTSVMFGDTAGTALHVMSSTQLQIVTPAEAAERVAVRVVAADGMSPKVPADRFRFWAKKGRITGTVSDVDTQTGIPGVGVEITRLDRAGRETLQTGAHGMYTAYLLVAGATYSVCFSGDGVSTAHAPNGYDDLCYDQVATGGTPTPVTISAGQTTPDIDAALTPQP